MEVRGTPGLLYTFFNSWFPKGCALLYNRSEPDEYLEFCGHFDTWQVIWDFTSFIKWLQYQNIAYLDSSHSFGDCSRHFSIGLFESGEVIGD